MFSSKAEFGKYLENVFNEDEYMKIAGIFVNEKEENFLDYESLSSLIKRIIEIYSDLGFKAVLDIGVIDDFLRDKKIEVSESIFETFIRVSILRDYFLDQIQEKGRIAFLSKEQEEVLLLARKEVAESLGIYNELIRLLKELLNKIEKKQKKIELRERFGIKEDNDDGKTLQDREEKRMSIKEYENKIFNKIISSLNSDVKSGVVLTKGIIGQTLREYYHSNENFEVSQKLKLKVFVEHFYKYVIEHSDEFPLLKEVFSESKITSQALYKEATRYK